MFGLATRPEYRIGRLPERIARYDRRDTALITPGRIVALAGVAAIIGIGLLYAPDMVRYAKIRSM